MRVLLAANASYIPPKGGSTRSNIVWLDHLKSSGHECRILAAGDSGTTDAGVSVVGVPELSRNPARLQDEIRAFEPDWVLVSSEDVAHTLLRQAWAAASDRLIYLAHTPQWYPFGPASWHPDPKAADIVRNCCGIVAIARTTQAYIREHLGAEATVIHPPIYGEPPWPLLAREEGAVGMINPCVVKGISIFLEMARRFPQTTFLGLAGWGTTSADRAAMAALPNVRVVEPVRHIDEVLSQLRLLLMPSLWFEGFGLIAEEAMLRGIPVIASNAGGLVEAKQGGGYTIPVRAIERFESAFDENHMPRPVPVPQDYDPWEQALRVLLTDDAEWRRESQQVRRAAVDFVSALEAGQFESYLRLLNRAEQCRSVPAGSGISSAKAQLLLQRLKERRKT